MCIPAGPFGDEPEMEKKAKILSEAAREKEEWLRMKSILLHPIAILIYITCLIAIFLFKK